jgi:hypothetical protein
MWDGRLRLNTAPQNCTKGHGFGRAFLLARNLDSINGLPRRATLHWIADKSATYLSLSTLSTSCRHFDRTGDVGANNMRTVSACSR